MILEVGSKVKFKKEKQRYTVQASSERFAVCTKPFNPRKTVLYTIIDFERNVRGTENLIFSFGFDTRQKCEEALDRLEKGESEVSYRNYCELNLDNLYMSNPYTCCKCKIEKSVTEFYINKRMAIGHSYKCKDCDKEHARNWHKKNGYFKTKKGKDAWKRASLKSTEKYPEKNQARVELRDAVRKGIIEKPDKCEYCGEHGIIHGHHRDYSRSLEVMWLCQKCHSNEHKVRK